MERAEKGGLTGYLLQTNVTEFARGVCATSLTNLLLMMQRCLIFARIAARRWTEEIVDG